MKNSVKITVKPNYVPERSSPVRSYYFFSYNITILNRGDTQVQLLSRYWHITDGQGNTEDIHGPGVIGEQPKLFPGEIFEYTSFCPLQTPIGFMEGSYRMISEKGNQFDAPISQFKLIATQFLN